MPIDFNTRDGGYTPFLHACEAPFGVSHDKTPILRMLLQKGSDPQTRCEIFDNSVLHLALLSLFNTAMSERAGCVSELRSQFVQLLTSLLQAGADPWSPNNLGIVPKELAFYLNLGNVWNAALRQSFGTQSPAVKTLAALGPKTAQGGQRFTDFMNTYRHWRLEGYLPDDPNSLGKRPSGTHPAYHIWESDAPMKMEASSGLWKLVPELKV
jgi:hypothetical protein